MLSHAELMLVLLSRLTAQIGFAAKYTAYPELCRVGSHDSLPTV